MRRWSRLAFLKAQAFRRVCRMRISFASTGCTRTPSRASGSRCRSNVRTKRERCCGATRRRSKTCRRPTRARIAVRSRVSLWLPSRPARHLSHLAAYGEYRSGISSLSGNAATVRRQTIVEALFDSSWLGPLLWVAVYISDYLMTLTCARMYQAQQTIVFEGSYEITPLFQADVNALRRVSPRFVIALLVSTGYLLFVQQTSSAAGSTSLYAGVLGANAPAAVRGAHASFSELVSLQEWQGRSGPCFVPSRPHPPGIRV